MTYSAPGFKDSAPGFKDSAPGFRLAGFSEEIFERDSSSDLGVLEVLHSESSSAFLDSRPDLPCEASSSM